MRKKVYIEKQKNINCFKSFFLWTTLYIYFKNNHNFHFELELSPYVHVKNGESIVNIFGPTRANDEGFLRIIGQKKHKLLHERSPNP